MASREPQPISPRTEARFKALAARVPYPSDDEIQQSLARPPAVNAADYYRWFIANSSREAAGRMNAAPTSTREAAELLKATIYNIRSSSLTELCFEINSSPGIVKLPLGNYTVKGKKTFCYLRFKDVLLPRDVPTYEPRGESLMTLLKCSLPSPNLPKLFYQLGQLYVSSTANAANARLTCFVIVVTPAREVFAIWNPSGAEPMYVPDSVKTSTAYQTRPVSGVFPGFANPCTAVLLSSNIDYLCQRDQVNIPLNLSARSFINLPAGSTMQYHCVPRA